MFIGEDAAYNYTLERTRSYLTPEIQVLELRCCMGTTAVYLVSGTKHLTGTDVSPEMVCIAQTKAAGIENLTFSAASATEARATQPRPDAVLVSVMQMVGIAPFMHCLTFAQIDAMI